MDISVNTKNMKIFEVLASETRIKMIETLADGPRNVGELARHLGISSAIVTRHITALEQVGFVKAETAPGKRGLQKICTLGINRLTLCFDKKAATDNFRYVSIPIGQFGSYFVRSTCGLASKTDFIGFMDDPRYFSDPERVHAALIWFQSGWVEYIIPGYVLPSPSPRALEVTLELSSEYPVYKEDWPSDIYFYINDICIGYWTCSGDFGREKGVYTPGWWHGGSEHGLLKNIRITQAGSFIDGVKLSNITLNKLNLAPNSNIKLKIASPADTKNPGGVNLYGKGFGNYDQDIDVRVYYE